MTVRMFTRWRWSRGTRKQTALIWQLYWWLTEYLEENLSWETTVFKAKTTCSDLVLKNVPLFLLTYKLVQKYFRKWPPKTCGQYFFNVLKLKCKNHQTRGKQHTGFEMNSLFLKRPQRVMRSYWMSQCLFLCHIIFNFHSTFYGPLQLTM